MASAAQQRIIHRNLPLLCIKGSLLLAIPFTTEITIIRTIGRLYWWIKVLCEEVSERIFEKINGNELINVIKEIFFQKTKAGANNINK